MNTAGKMVIATAGVSALLIFTYEFNASRERTPAQNGHSGPEVSIVRRAASISPEELVSKLAPHSGAKGYDESRKILAELDDEGLRQLCVILMASKNDRDSMLLSLALAEGITRDVDQYYDLMIKAPPMMLANASKAAFTSLCRMNPDLAREYLISLSPDSGIDQSILRQGIESLIITHPEIAVNLAKEDPRLIDTIISSLLDASLDIDNVFAIVASFERDEDRKLALLAAVRTLSRKDSPTCFTAIATLDPESFRIAGRELFSNWMSVDWDAASVKAKSLNNDEIHALLSSSVIFDTWLARDAESLSKIVQGMQLDDNTSEIFERYYTQRRDSDIGQNLREIGQLAVGGARDSLVMALLREVKGESLEVPLALLGEVRDPKFRLSLAKALARAMHDRVHEHKREFLETLNPVEKDAVVLEFSNRVPLSEARDFLSYMTDSSTRSLAEGRIWERERDQLHKEVVSNPQKILGDLAHGMSAYSDYWIEEAMATWISKEPAKAEEWYHSNWDSLPVAKSQYVAAAYAKEALRLGDTATARQWTNLIQDPKTKDRIAASIDKAQSTQGQ